MDSAPQRTGETVRSMDERVTEVDQRDLLSRIVARDRDAMRDFYLLYQHRVACFLARIMVRREPIEDLVNEVFVIVWQRAAEYRGDSRVSTWVMGIAWSHGLTSLRREQRRAAWAASSRILHTVKAECPERRDVRENQPMRTLSPEHRAVIELAYVGGHSCEEIGVIMRCPANVVKTRLIHARHTLRALEAGNASGVLVGRSTPVRLRIRELLASCAMTATVGRRLRGGGST